MHTGLHELVMILNLDQVRWLLPLAFISFFACMAMTAHYLEISSNVQTPAEFV